MSQQIINGDSAEVLKTIDSNIIDAVITDPPYGIEFLGKDLDNRYCDIARRRISATHEDKAETLFT